MAVCAQCKTQLSAGQEILIRESTGRNAAFVPYCSLCAAEKEKQIQLETQERNYFGALLLGGAAGVLGGLVWYAIVVFTQTQYTYLAIALGALIGFAVMFGAGKKRGLPLQLMGAAITLGTMALSEYFIVRHYVVEAKYALGHRHFPLLYPLEDIFEFLKTGISADPITLFFWLAALVVAFSIPARRKLTRKDPGGLNQGLGSYPT